jgi:Copper type II ascorbate-dependent monooxygenase, C-terminal domain
MTRLDKIRIGALLLLASGACGSDPAQPSVAMNAATPTSPAPKASETPANSAAAGSTAMPMSPAPAANGGESESMTPAEPPANPPAASKPPASPTTPAGQVPEQFMGDAGDGWKTLIAGSWDVPPGQETYHCVRFTLPDSITATSFRALSPPGTHHTLLTIVDNPSEADGSMPCGSGTNGRRSITGSGVGSNDLSMPEGVAMQVKAGQQLLLNLHLFNVTDKPIKGTSGTLFKPVAESAVKQYAEGILAGQTNLSIPVGGPTKQSGECTTTHDTAIFAVSPHMHQLGVHLKAVAHSSMAGEVVLIDSPYSFDEQLVYPLKSEVPMKKGDKIHVECTFQNTTDKPVKFGESSLAEMCFAGIYRYPAGDPGFVCVR